MRNSPRSKRWANHGTQQNCLEIFIFLHKSKNVYSFSFLMTEQELEKLMGNTAITLSSGEKEEFLKYFDGMITMLEQFYHFDFPKVEITEEEKKIECFDEQTDFCGEDLITTNVNHERIKNHSVEIVSHISK